MSSILFQCLARSRFVQTLLLLGLTCAVQAQTQPTRAPHPENATPQIAQNSASEASAPIAAPVYTSVLSRYRSMQDIGVVPWRESNAVVNRAGGWRAYARDAQEAAPSDAQPAKPQDQPAKPSTGPAPATVPTDPHAGHRSKP